MTERRALVWVDEEQLARRLTREEPSFVELVYGTPRTSETVDYWLNAVLDQRARNVGRG